MSVNKMTKQEKLEWDELYQYVKKEILKYEDNISLPRNLILRLKGLSEGKFMANKATKSMGNYTFAVILNTFKINKFDIINALSNKNKFKNENHMINYMMVIIENKINDTYMRMKKAKVAEEKGQNIDINMEDDKAEYKSKTKEVKNSRLKDLL